MEKKALDAIKLFSDKGFQRRRVWQTDSLHCNIYCFEPGQANNLHRHPVSNEVVWCWEGEGIVMVGEEQAPIRAGETALVPVNVPHGYINTSKDRRMIIIVIQCPLPVEHVPVEPGEIAAFIRS